MTCRRKRDIADEHGKSGYDTTPHTGTNHRRHDSGTTVEHTQIDSSPKRERSEGTVDLKSAGKVTLVTNMQWIVLGFFFLHFLLVVGVLVGVIITHVTTGELTLARIRLNELLSVVQLYKPWVVDEGRTRQRQQRNVEREFTDGGKSS